MLKKTKNFNFTFKVVTSQSYANYPKIQPFCNSTFYVIAFITAYV